MGVSTWSLISSFGTVKISAHAVTGFLKFKDFSLSAAAVLMYGRVYSERNVKGITIFTLLYWFSCATHGGVYQWTDENGHVHFGSIPPHQQNEYSLGDQIKAAQPDQPLKKAVQIETPVQEKILEKPSESPQKINSTPVRKVSREELEAIIIKLRFDAGKAVQRIKGTNPRLQKSVAEDADTPQNKVPAAVASAEKSETKNETSGEATVSKINSTPVKLEKPEKVKIVQPVVDKNPEVEAEKSLEAKNRLSTIAVVKESIVVLPPAVESGDDSDLYGEEDATNEDNEIVLEENSDSDKCGLFMGFVEQYKIKRDEGCPGSHCKVYKQQLEKFRMKEKRYCS